MASQAPSAPAVPSTSQGPGWGIFVGGVLLGSTVAAGAAYLAVRYGASAAASADEWRRSASSSRRRQPRCALALGPPAVQSAIKWHRRWCCSLVRCIAELIMLEHPRTAPAPCAQRPCCCLDYRHHPTSLLLPPQPPWPTPLPLPLPLPILQLSAGPAQHHACPALRTAAARA